MPGIKGQRRKNLHDRARERAWQSMRILRVFDLAQILATADISKDNAKKYILRLRRAGYVVCVQDRVNGRPGSRNTYRLARNTGPKAPVPFLDGGVYDPNLDTIFGKPEEA